MTGEYKITHDHMKALGPCADGWRDFLTAYPREEYPDGVAYQDILDRCADEGSIDYAYWLIHKIGPTDDVREYTEEIVDADKHIAFAGTIIFRKNATVKNITAGGSIVADESIEAGGSITAGLSIKAGGSIDAGVDITAGGIITAGGYIKAGLSIKAGGIITAGVDITAGLSITADESIKAGGIITAGGSIDAGVDITAGLSIKAGGSIDAGVDITAGGIIKAKTKPKNIVYGEYQQI